MCLCLKLCVFLFSPLQTVVLSLLMRSIGNKNTILLGLGFQILQLAWYGFGSEPWWVRGWGLWSCDFTEGIFEMLFWVFFFFYIVLLCLVRMMWAAGAVAAMSSITFPAVSALVSRTADPDQQGETIALRFISMAKWQYIL